MQNENKRMQNEILSENKKYILELKNLKVKEAERINKEENAKLEAEKIKKEKESKLEAERIKKE